MGLIQSTKAPKHQSQLPILCTGGPDVIRKEAWRFYRTISGVRLCWKLEEPEGLKGPIRPEAGLSALRRLFEDNSDGESSAGEQLDRSKFVQGYLNNKKMHPPGTLP